MRGRPTCISVAIVTNGDEPTNVIKWPVNINENVDLEPDKVLEAAKGKLDKVIVVGWVKTEEGGDGELYCAASSGDLARSILLLKLCERKLLSYIDED